MKITKYQICVIHEKNDKKGLGTGFSFLKNDWIVTAKHVVMVDGLPRNGLYAKFPLDSINIVNLVVHAIHDEADIAILRIIDDTNLCDKPLYPGYEELGGSKGLICMGYAPSLGNVINMTHIKHYENIERERAVIESIFEFNSQHYEPGCSGGPIFGTEGTVLGLLINLIKDETEPEKTLVRGTSIMNLMQEIDIGLIGDRIKLIE